MTHFMSCSNIHCSMINVLFVVVLHLYHTHALLTIALLCVGSSNDEIIILHPLHSQWLHNPLKEVDSGIVIKVTSTQPLFPGLHAQLLLLAVRKVTKAGCGGLGMRLTSTLVQVFPCPVDLIRGRTWVRGTLGQCGF